MFSDLLSDWRWYHYILVTIVSIILFIIFAVIIMKSIVEKKILNNLRNEYQNRASGKLPKFEPKDWAYILGTPYAAVEEYPCNDPIIVPGSKDAGSLQTAWGINDRESLIAQLFHLLTNGHRHKFRQEVYFFSDVSESDYEQIKKDIQKEEDEDGEAKELLWRAEVVRKNLNNIQTVNFLAWDYVRYIKLICNGISTEYLDREEADNFVQIITHTVQREYKSWEEFWHHFLLGRWYWSSTDMRWTITQDLYGKIVTLINKEPGGPSNTLNWNTNLSEANIAPFINAVLTLGYENEEGKKLGEDEIKNMIQSTLENGGYFPEPAEIQE
ncbi:DUF1266 domain-containing protein [Photorhabdus australis]|uniref:DUF1266 domain-containing protein n=1 Tax=Photorhabdus australis TaxID=286156 RepID=UPI00055EE071|nr:DUF1266 domain-containing protein [Photorhabdus australis]